LDEDYAWKCSSYCTDAYGGEIPEGVSYNRAEGSSSCVPTLQPTVTLTIQPISQPTLTPTANPTLEPTTEIFEIMEPTVRPTTQSFETARPISKPTVEPTKQIFETTLEPTTETTNMTVELRDSTNDGKTSNIIAFTVGGSFFAAVILVLYVKSRSSYKRLENTSVKGLQLSNKRSLRNCRGAKVKHSLVSQTDGGLQESNEAYGAVPTNQLSVDHLERNPSQNDNFTVRGITVD